MNAVTGPAHWRALLIGMLGPVIQAIGVAWDLLEHAVLEHGGEHASTMRHILFGGPHLVIFAGFALALMCVPLALQVAVAPREELEQPEFGRRSHDALFDAAGLEAAE